MANNIVPLLTVERLSVYLRTLEEAASSGKEHISSDELASANGYTSAQVRKDITCFGRFGKKGRGYPVNELIARLRYILGLDRIWKVCLVGLGHLGETLARGRGFNRSGFVLSAIFEKKKKLIGTHFRGVPIYSIDELGDVVKSHKIKIAVVAVPARSAKDTIARLVDAGVQGILNFTDVKVVPPDGIVIRNVDIASNLETISFYLHNPNAICLREL